jgi:hypothetical protein
MCTAIDFMSGFWMYQDEPILTLVPSLVPRGNLGLRNFYGVGKVLILKDAPVAQLDRAFDYESKGRVFESRRAHHLNSTTCRRFPLPLLQSV